MIRSIQDVKATEMGGSQRRFKAEVDFDGRNITRSYLENLDTEKILKDVQALKSANELETFMIYHGEKIIDRVGAEVDRIENDMKKRHPQLRHVDLEQL